MESFWKTLSVFLLGILSGLAVFLKLKKPDTTIVEGDQIDTQKVKDNSKYKLSRRERRKQRKEARILKRKNKAVN